MCPLPGPTHQSLTRNMPLPRARSHFSPHHSIKATLCFLMEEGGGGTLVIFHQSHRQYIPSHHIERVNGKRTPVHVVVIWRESLAPLNDLTDLRLTSELSNHSGYDRCHQKDGRVQPMAAFASCFKVEPGL